MNTESVNTERLAIQRITRDISDGLLYIDNSGTVLYVNPSAVRILGSDALAEGVKYAEYMAADENSANDGFHQYILDSIYDKGTSHTGTVTYTRPDGSIRWFSISASYAFSEDGSRKFGVILQFSDITELHETRIKREDTVKVLVDLLAITAVWNYVYMIWKVTGEPIPSSALTMIIEVIGVISTAFALRYTSITWKDFGLGTENLKKVLVDDTILTLYIIALMIVIKWILRHFFPNIVNPAEPFFHWDRLDAKDLIYIVTVVLQEFLTRGVVQGSLDRVLPEHYPPAISIIISSLFFGALHLHKGLVFMVGAAVLLSFFGVIYRKQKTIWGLCIPHLFLSWSLVVIWGM